MKWEGSCGSYCFSYRDMPGFRIFRLAGSFLSDYYVLPAKHTFHYINMECKDKFTEIMKFSTEVKL